MQEISRLLPPMLLAAKRLPAYQFVIAGAPSLNEEYYRQFLTEGSIPIVFNATYDLLSNASAAVVASGTATLETALFNVPQLVVYKGHPISITIARMVIKVKFISLVNLIAGKQVVKELIQQDCSPDNIHNELLKILEDQEYLDKMLMGYDGLDDKMGQPGASAKTAGLIIKYVSKK